MISKIDEKSRIALRLVATLVFGGVCAVIGFFVGTFSEKTSWERSIDGISETLTVYSETGRFEDSASGPYMRKSDHYISYYVGHVGVQEIFIYISDAGEINIYREGRGTEEDDMGGVASGDKLTLQP